MSLEATMLVLDTSNYALNGDYTPTRLQAQADAVHVVFNRKVQANPESEVGLMVMGGKSPEVLVTPTQDEGKLIAALHSVKPAGDADLATAINVAQLALKHRQNKNQRQRIIVFVGSPLNATSAALVKLGKKMKKNNVAIDLISFGSDAASSIDMTIPSIGGASSSSAPAATPETNETKLLALHEAVNSSDNSHYLHVEPGPHLLSERISASAILRGEGAGGDDDMGGGGGGDEYGVDPNLDPELALALRMSLEEERARQQAASSTSAPAASATSTLEAVPESSDAASAAAGPTLTDSDATVKTESTSDDAAAVLAAAAASGQVEDVGMEHDGGDEDDDLARALALSRGDGDDVEMGDAGAATASGEAEDDEDAEIQRAIALSMQESEENKEEANK